MSFVGIVAIFLFAILSALLWSYGLEILTKCVKFILLGIFKLLKLILFGGKKESGEEKRENPGKVKEKTS